MRAMFNCCGSNQDICKDFDCKVEKTEKGLNITIESNDPKKAEALQKLYEAQKELCGCGDSCC